MLFENSVLKTQKIYAFTQVSQGLLSRIVAILLIEAQNDTTKAERVQKNPFLIRIPSIKQT